MMAMLLCAVFNNELILGTTAALLVRKGARLICRCELHFSVLKICTRPLLVEELVYTLSLFFSLDVLHEGEHSCLSEVATEDLTDKRVHVETSESNELPAVAHRCKIRDESFDFFFTHFLGIPIERWREVVGE